MDRRWMEEFQNVLEQVASCLGAFPSITPMLCYLSVLGERLGSEVRHGLGKTCGIATPLQTGG